MVTPTRGLASTPNGGDGGLPPDSVYQTGGWASLSTLSSEHEPNADKLNGGAADDGENEAGDWQPRRRLEPVLLPHPSDRVDVLPLSPSKMNGMLLTPTCALPLDCNVPILMLLQCAFSKHVVMH